MDPKTDGVSNVEEDIQRYIFLWWNLHVWKNLHVWNVFSLIYPKKKYLFKPWRSQQNAHDGFSFSKAAGFLSAPGMKNRLHLRRFWTCFVKMIFENIVSVEIDAAIPEHALANIYLFKVNNRHFRKRCETCSKLTIKTPEWRQWRLMMFLLLTLNIFHTFL